MAVAPATNPVITPVDLQKQIDLFNRLTAHKVIVLDTMTPAGATGGVTSLTIRRVGLLQGIFLPINVTVGGTVNTPNALGIASLIRRIRVAVNSSGNLIDVSGSAWVNMVNEQIGSEYDLAQGTTQNQGNTAVTATSFKLFIYLPIAMNRRDVHGLVLLQSEQQTVSLEIDWSDQITVGGTTATYTASVKPYIDVLTIPNDSNGGVVLPPLKYYHQLLQQQDTFTGAGDLTINPIRNNIYLTVFHATTLAASMSELASRLRIIRNGSDQVFDYNVDMMDMLYYLNHGRSRRAGIWAQEYMATTGQGMFGLTRDLFNSYNYTDYQHIITLTGTSTVDTIRRMLEPIKGQ